MSARHSHSFSWSSCGFLFSSTMCFTKYRQCRPTGLGLTPEKNPWLDKQKHKREYPSYGFWDRLQERNSGPISKSIRGGKRWETSIYFVPSPSAVAELVQRTIFIARSMLYCILQGKQCNKPTATARHKTPIHTLTLKQTLISTSELILAQFQKKKKTKPYSS